MTASANSSALHPLPSLQPGGRIRVVVTGAGALLGQGIMRSLRSSSLDIEMIGVDVSNLAAGLYWCDRSCLVPPAAEPGYLDAIRRLLALERPHLLLAGTDVELPVLAAARAALEAEFQCRVLVSDSRVVEIADDKYKTAGFMRQAGFAAPDSVLATDAPGVAALVGRCGFPLIVKPCIGARSVGVHKVQGPEQLERVLAGNTGAVVQECVGGDDAEFTASGLYFDGACRASIVMRRDLRDGNTYRAFVVEDPALDAIVRTWTEALKPHGPANFQFRIDRQGVPKVFEINARFSGTTPLRAHAGFNEVEMCLRRLLLGQPVVQPTLKPVTILRYWSETVIESGRPSGIQAI